ncbi:KdsC family phosphatase [Reinekea thalattae]|uniref:3-deoxy-D-manno-octulosonate 8-phosphate phosphatase KdsC n=1 Tax=Reinekea thalattae TaxID=2593301 RepID=A0A5C8Z889_9GAMM|nr:HAD-IIIA family hydrolase [Reinekea thalattae]TXR53539.1 HAD-IIIA family hydrolase [Reinekea thalattae]
MTYSDDLTQHYQGAHTALNKISLVVFDVDGVLTNGQLVYGSNGEVVKLFNVKDGVGIKLLQDQSIAVAVVTAKDSAMVDQRMSDLGVEYYFKGVKDKVAIVQQLLDRLELSLEQVCYVGDDMVDLSVMTQVGVSICPSDAYALVCEQASIVLPLGGGQGVARLVCDIVLNAKGVLAEAYKLAATPLFERNRS